uniref:Zinc finger piccolo-type domain-containing protein n=1 Tax=Echeneis naucrates TaxID=173247 RepID=A0A665V4K5_ECHNA
MFGFGSSLFSSASTMISSAVQDQPKTTPPISPKMSPAKEIKPTTVQKKEDQKKPEHPQQAKTPPSIQPDQTSQTARKPGNAATATKQDSGGFFGFSSPKSQRAASQTTEAVTGKMLGFGSSLFSSASTLITSAVKEESHTTPPSSRKMSAPAEVSSPPVSPRMASAKEAKPPVQKLQMEAATETAEQAKAPPAEQTEMDKGLSQPEKPEATKTSIKGVQSCPLCKAELNVGSKDLPNYNTCTECKTKVCNKCGFSPMPNVNQHSTHNFLALLGQLGDSGKKPQPSPVSARPETQATPASPKAQPTSAAINTSPKMEPSTVQPETAPTEAYPEIKLDVTPTTEKISPTTEEKEPQAESEAESTKSSQQRMEEPAKVELRITDVLETETKDEAVKKKQSVTEVTRADESQPDLAKVIAEADTAAASGVPLTEGTVEPTPTIAAEEAPTGVLPETELELFATERILKEVQPHDHIEVTATTVLEKEEGQPKTQEAQLLLETEQVMEADSTDVADKLVKKIDITSPPEELSTKSSVIKVRTALI